MSLRSPSASAASSSLQLSLVALDDPADRVALATRWRALEARAEGSFFTRWAWIGTWLALLPDAVRPRLLQARRGERDVGLALVVDGPGRQRFGLPFCRTAWLHATGRPEFDILTIEHNDFLIAADDAEGADAVRAAMLAHWAGRLRGVTEIVLPGLAGPGWPAGCEARLASRRLEREDWVRRSYAVDLKAVRAAGGDFLKLISANSRSQIRRSMKEYGQLGALTLMPAASTAQALDWLERLAVLHQAHCTGRGQPGAFANDFFFRFHRTLVEHHHDSGAVQMLRVAVGEHDLGFLYSFIHRGRVYFYQSGLEYGLIEKHARPGLVAHVLAAQHNAALGHEVYDFMAGESRYKTTLATLDEQMTWTTLRTSALRFELEAALRRRRQRRAGAVESPEALAD